MKGDEGWFLVILSVIVCISNTYTDSMKGEGFSHFAFQISAFYSNFRYVGITFGDSSGIWPKRFGDSSF